MFKRLAIFIAAALVSMPLYSHGKTMLVIHGGAGTITRASMSAEMEQQYRAALEQALRTGHAILAKGGSSLDAVEATVRVMEDSPLFNAGKGAVFSREGRNELDASIMEGRTKNAGAVAGVTIIRNPITAARAVMERSRHVMLSGRGADLFATQMGLDIVDPSYFWTERRWKALQNQLMQEQRKPQADLEVADENRFGTVGAVALDSAGNLAAATSTGGTGNKLAGRVGDAPIIGAGTYADNEACAVSATGDGEYFIRASVAHDIVARVKYRGTPLQKAGDEVLAHVKALGGTGGVIILDAKGNFATPFNTEGMYRGWIGADGKPQVQIYGD